MLSIYSSGCCHYNLVDIACVTPFLKSYFPYPSCYHLQIESGQRKNFMHFFHSMLQILSILSLCRICTCFHNHCEFLGMTPCFAWKTHFCYVFLKSTTSTSHIVFSHSSSMSPESFQWGFKIEFQFRAENSTDSHSLHLH